MTSFRNWLWAVPICLGPTISLGDINVRDASYTQTVDEWDRWFLKKTYSSRSLHDGFFGHGWCTELEKSLAPRDGIRRHCGVDQKVSPRKAGLLWIVALASNEVELYNSDGQLVGIKKPQEPWIRIQRSLNRQLQTVNYRDETYDLSLDPENNRITQIKRGSQSATYLFSQRDLNQIQSSFKARWEFKYDVFHNMVHFQRDQNRQEKIVYRTEADEVLSVQASNGCKDSLRTERLNPLEMKATLTRKCPGRQSKSAVFQFIAQKTKSGRLSLEKIKIAGEGHESLVLP